MIWIKFIFCLVFRAVATQNVNECDIGTHNCSDNATCTDTIGGYTCTCNQGFVGDGLYCTNVNKYDRIVAPICPDNADLIGSSCVCKQGFVGDGFICTNVNECDMETHNCLGNATCTDTIGSYICTCDQGFVGDGFYCTTCDSSSDVTQCSVGEICTRYGCEQALNCGEDSNLCLSVPGLGCVSDYCQRDPCTSTGQCVHGHVCSQDTPRRCVYPVVINVIEGSEVKFAFQEPAPPGSYEEIQWYKGGRNNLNRVAVIHPVITENKIEYYNDFCPYKSPCNESDRAHLNTYTGDLTIFNIALAYEGFYYYKFDILNGLPDTGLYHEYKLNVYVIPKRLTIEGVPTEYVEVGTNLTLTCTVDRIKPQAQDMYWVVHGRNETEALSSRGSDVDGVYTQTSTYMHVVTREDKSVPIRCVVVPVYGELVEVEAVIKPGYAPFGRPRVEVSGNDHYEGEKVTLTCVEDANPPCDSYFWTRLEGNINYLPATQIYTFIMDQLHTGNYTCQCNNEFGESETSDVVEILYLGERPKISSKDKRGLIAGCVIGVLVLVALVVAAVFVCKKYQFNLQIKSRSITAADRVNQEMDEYENPMNNNVNSEPTNEYHYIDGHEQNQMNNNVNAEPSNRPNEYQYIDVRAMDRAGDAGYMNPAVTNYEDVL